MSEQSAAISCGFLLSNKFNTNQVLWKLFYLHSHLHFTKGDNSIILSFKIYWICLTNDYSLPRVKCISNISFTEFLCGTVSPIFLLFNLSLFVSLFTSATSPTRLNCRWSFNSEAFHWKTLISVYVTSGSKKMRLDYFILFTTNLIFVVFTKTQ